MANATNTDDFEGLFDDLHTFAPADRGDAAARAALRQRKSDAAALAHTQASAWGRFGGRPDPEAAKAAAREAAARTI